MWGSTALGPDDFWDFLGLGFVWAWMDLRFGVGGCRCEARGVGLDFRGSSGV